MSYDLYLGRSEPLAPDEFAEVVGRTLNFKLDGNEAFYANPATGVYFALELGDPFAEEDDDELPPPPLPVVAALNLNFNRAAFFGLECFDVMEPICRALDVLVFSDYEEEPAPFDPDDQFERWDAGNHAAADIVAKQDEPPPFMERERAIEWWQYARRKPEIDERFRREDYDVFAPTLMLVRDAQTESVLRAIAWPDAIPIVVPPCDLLIVQRTTGGRFRRKSEQGVIDAPTGLARIEAHLQPFDDDLRILTPEASARDDVRAAVAAYDLRPFDTARYEGVAPDGFADLRPETA